MPVLDGIQVIRQIRETVPKTKVLVLTMHDSDQMIQRALDAGASGYVLKTDLAQSLVDTIKDIAASKRSLTPKVSEIVLEAFLKGDHHRQAERRESQPTSRELEIIRLLAEGKLSKEIAHELGIAIRTVDAHRANIMEKLAFHSLADLIHYALRQGIIAPPNHPSK
jgi:DNA-binding NarL/FixJ family response regulator